MTGWALVTGASRGLGREFAALAAADGLNLVLTARSDADLQAVAAQLRAAHGVTVEVIATDLAAPGAAQALWAKANAHHPITVLVNNAGLGRHGRFTDGGWEREAESIALNVTAYTALNKAALTDMAPGGRILSVASLAAFLPGPNMAVYHATKAYALLLDDALRNETKGSGITLTTLCAGHTKTGFFDAAEVRETWLMRLIPIASAATVARAGWNGAKRGRTRIVPGVLNKLIAVSSRLLPRGVAAWIAGLLLAKTGR